VAIAEKLAGNEKEFAKLMTLKARALGMSRTVYVNASGLPDDDQITTARDQALLGRAIEDRFPGYYPYFATREFAYHGVAMRNHNHLLGSLEGVDGIKTGYTQESGFNLVTSVHRDGHYIIGVVLGGSSAFERDANMRELINDHIGQASFWRTAPLITESTEGSDPAADAKISVGSGADRLPAPSASAIQPALVKTFPSGAALAQAQSHPSMLGTMPVGSRGAASTLQIPHAADPFRPVPLRSIPGGHPHGARMDERTTYEAVEVASAGATALWASLPR
jgi:D-alanyl-D-alanine carboxypeptidase